MIGFIGLSHLGLNYSLATAAKGFAVLAYDPDAELVSRIGEGDFPIDEPGFAELWRTHRRQLRYTARAEDLRDCDLVFYALDVRTNEHNASDLGPLTRLIESTAPALAEGGTAVVLSQVRPGYMRKLIGGWAGGTPGSSALQRTAWYYQVETLVFGAAVERAMNPERYIVGALDPSVPLPPPYRLWLDRFKCPVLIMRYESAELAKIAINFYLVSAVSTTNTLAELCEAIGADWSEIAPALRLDRRIGPHAYLLPGLGIAGGNLERDLVTVQGLAAEHGTEAGLVAAWQRNSAHAKGWALRQLERRVFVRQPAARIAIWGLAYKQDTHSVKNSAAVALIEGLMGRPVQAYDPVARIDPEEFPGVRIAVSAAQALRGADVLVIMTPWPEFSRVPATFIRQELAGVWVIDPYGILDADSCRACGLRHLRLGRA